VAGVVTAAPAFLPNRSSKLPSGVAGSGSVWLVETKGNEKLGLRKEKLGLRKKVARIEHAVGIRQQ
jgi:hypothetical protein